MSSKPWYRKIEKIRKDWVGKPVNQKTLIGYIKNDYLGEFYILWTEEFCKS